jgi:hypothetical protein
MLSAAVFCAGLAACGDDDVTPPTDGGDVDSNVPPTDLGPPTDGGGAVDAGTLPAGCDPYADGSCPTGEKCAVVIRNSGLPNVAITFECVPSARQRLVGQVCNFENLPGARPVDGGIVDYYDLCEQGTFCWDTQPIPGYPPQPRTCQALCGADGVYCGDTEYCQLLNSDDPATAVVEPTFGTCTPAAGCDPVFQTGCAIPGDACYLVYSTRAEMLGACLAVDTTPDAGTPFAPGTPCDYATQCAPGSGCLPDVVAGAFGTGARVCREYCQVPGSGGGYGAGDGGVDDAAVDVDADVDAGPADVDAGPAEVDAGPAEVDAGPAEVDAGPAEIDAGPAAVDAGPPAVDAGPPAVDAGPPSVDAGPPDLGHDAGPPRTGLCASALTCVAFPIGDPDAGMPIRVPTDPGICQ